MRMRFFCLKYSNVTYYIKKNYTLNFFSPHGYYFQKTCGPLRFFFLSERKREWGGGQHIDVGKKILIIYSSWTLGLDHH